MINEIIVHKTLEVGGFVFLTTLFYYLVKEFIPNKFKIKKDLFLGSILGISPGCGGAISAATLFTTNALSVGALVAAMVATMGDGAFILLVQKPKEFIFLTSIMFATSLVIGFFVNKFKLLSSKNEVLNKQPIQEKYHEKHLFNKFNNQAYKIFFLIMPIISIMGIGHAFGFVKEAALHNEVIEIFVYFILALTFVNTIIINRLKTCANSCNISCFSENKIKFIFKKTFEKTSNILTLLFISLLFIEIMIALFNIDFSIIKTINPYLAIIIAALFGLIPGSGPQIIITTLYIQGAIPFTVLLANAITTTGDAGFILFKEHRRNLVEIILINFLVGSFIATVLQLTIST